MWVVCNLVGGVIWKCLLVVVSICSSSVWLCFRDLVLVWVFGCLWVLGKIFIVVLFGVCRSFIYCVSFRVVWFLKWVMVVIGFSLYWGLNKVVCMVLKIVGGRVVILVFYLGWWMLGIKRLCLWILKCGVWFGGGVFGIRC